MFGGVHLIAWKFSFPSETEPLLWWTSTLVTIILPLAFVTTSAFVWGWFCIKALRRGPPPAFDDCEDVIRALRILNSNDIRPEDRQTLSSNNIDSNRGLWMHVVAQLRLRDEELRSMPTDKEWRLFDIMTTGQIGKKFQEHDSNESFNSFETIVELSKIKPSKKQQFDYNLRLAFREEELGFLRAKKLSPQPSRGETFRRLLRRFVLFSASLLYIASRLSVLAVALSSLRSMPDSAYVATWAKYLPFVD